MAAFLATFWLSQSGCSFIGAAVGNSFTKVETVPVSPYSARRGDTIEVSFEDSMGPYTVAGAYQGTVNNELVIASPPGMIRVPLAQVRLLRIETGTYWVEGMLPGLAIDALAAGAIFITATSKPHAPTGFGGGFD
jgi:hypothetical protein